ncbi:hypothetical protein CCMSSC00406_0001330 [Pleurotus cornucopiae]|uniref:Uncharacterized protein n=1 Tax=Pleurotus cornucopiae TaxID=5321 RepID=A0ACB7ING6_PLECO|nr:hypothetical protein CCMSSC00406_0001330 [Pleurotus cornucopiae]
MHIKHTSDISTPHCSPLSQSQTYSHNGCKIPGSYATPTHPEENTMSARASPLPPPRSPVVHEGLGQHFHGDFYAASQMGGTAGGHGNTNTTFNGGEETHKVQIEKIKAKLDANIMDDADHYLSLGQLSKITKELNGLLSQVGELQGRIREKAGL